MNNKLDNTKTGSITAGLMHRLLSLFLVFVFIFSLPGCASTDFIDDSLKDDSISNIISPDPQENEEFTNYVNKLFAEIISEDTMSLHAYIEHPENFGIDDYDVTLGRYDLENLDETTDISQYLTELQSFDRSTLSQKQKLTYDQLTQFMQTELEYSDLYLFNTQLATTTGIQVQLPLLFAEYTFVEKKDIEEYLTLLEDVDGFLSNLMEYEKIRSSKGYFMEDTLIDEIIETCESFKNSADDAEDGVLITTFNERIDAFAGLTDEEKDSYKARNSAAVTDHVVKGYQIMIDELSALKGTNQYKGGLCAYPEGTSYYEYLLADSLGWDKTVDEFDALLDSYMSKYMLSMQGLMMKDPSLMDQFESFSFNMEDPKAMIEDLKTRITDDFPALNEVDYDIKYISKSLEDYASPAMYFIPQLDNLNVNSIYINSAGTSDNELYPTLAHEGYPGHLYQTQYFAAGNPDRIRYILEPGGYVEGWASYVEVLAYNYAQTGNESLNRLMGLNYATILCIYAKGDIGVNYYGWTEEELLSFISQWGFNDESVAHEMYYAFISDPANYCKYVLGMLGFEELKSHAENALGSSFVLKDFHQYVLDMGPIQFDILFSNLPAWEERQKHKTV